MSNSPESQQNNDELVDIQHPDLFEDQPDPEIDSYIEKVEKAGENPSLQIPLDDQGQALIQQTDDTQLPDNAVILPMTQIEFEQGLQAQILSSARWLAEWCAFMIKKYGRRVFFKG